MASRTAAIFSFFSHFFFVFGMRILSIFAITFFFLQNEKKSPQSALFLDTRPLHRKQTFFLDWPDRCARQGLRILYSLKYSVFFPDTICYFFQTVSCLLVCLLNQQIKSNCIMGKILAKSRCIMGKIFANAISLFCSESHHLCHCLHYA